MLPGGTLSGAPKVRAMELIEEHELTRRGLYGGIVGYLDFAGNADTAIAIRTGILAGERAFVQAGAGVVADSDPVYSTPRPRTRRWPSSTRSRRRERCAASGTFRDRRPIRTDRRHPAPRAPHQDDRGVAAGTRGGGVLGSRTVALVPGRGRTARRTDAAAGVRREGLGLEPVADAARAGAARGDRGRVVGAGLGSAADRGPGGSRWVVAAIPVISLLKDGADSGYAGDVADMPDRYQVLFVDVHEWAVATVLAGSALCVAAGVPAAGGPGRCGAGIEVPDARGAPRGRRARDLPRVRGRKAAQAQSPGESAAEGGTSERMLWDALDTGLDPTDLDVGDNPAPIRRPLGTRIR